MIRVNTFSIAQSNTHEKVLSMKGNVMKTKAGFLLLAAVLFGVGGTHAADYFVSPSGSDGNPGTMTLPWATLEKAGKTAAAGDTVHFREGVYAAPLFPANSGTADSYITFKAYAGEHVVIEGGTSLSAGWSVHSGSIFKTGLSSTYLRASWGTGNDIAGTLGFVNLDRRIGAEGWLKPAHSLGEIAAGTWLYDGESSTLYVWLPDSSHPNNHQILVTTSYRTQVGIWVHSRSYIRFENLNVRFCGEGISVDQGAPGSHHIEFDNIEITGGYTGIVTSPPSTHITMNDLRIHDMTGVGIQNNASHCSITNSSIYNTGIVDWLRWGSPGIILLGSNNTVSHCDIHHIGLTSRWGPGIQNETWGSQNGVYGEGDSSHDNIMEHNVIHDSPQIGITFSGADNCIARRNVIYNVARGMWIYIGGLAGGMTPEQQISNSNKIYNNTFVNCTNEGVMLSSGGKNTHILNNIFYGNGRELSADTDSMNQYTSNYNCFYLRSGGSFRYGNNYFNDVAGYTGSSNQDRNSLTVDPLFSDISSFDFSLRPDSPLIDRGFVMEGMEYSGSGPDIGGLESPRLMPPLIRIIQ